MPVAAQLASALRYLHAAGVVHRDIKARNVLLRSGDVPCLIDFSLAASIDERTPLSGGTAAYQSASRRLGGPANIADDVHAFAVLVYELWSGALPFGRDLVSSTLASPKKEYGRGIGPFSDALELALTR